MLYQSNLFPQIAVQNRAVSIGLYKRVSNNKEMIRRNNQGIFDVEAEIKAEVFMDIFDSMTKNMKQNQKIFFIFTHKQMKMWLSETSKTTQLQLKIGLKAFKQYNCNFPSNKVIFRKYQLKRFLYFSSFFESCKGNFKVYISEDKVQFEDSSNGVRKSTFPVRGETISEDEEEDLMNTNIMTEFDDRNCCTLRFPKSKIIQEVIHSGNAMKISKLWLSYISNEKQLKFDFRSNDGPYLKVKTREELSKGTQISKIPFPFRKLKLATSLIESEKPFKMNLSRNALMINYDEENVKKYNILVLAEFDE